MVVRVYCHGVRAVATLATPGSYLSNSPSSGSNMVNFGVKRLNIGGKILTNHLKQAGDRARHSETKRDLARHSEA